MNTTSEEEEEDISTTQSGSSTEDNCKVYPAWYKNAFYANSRKLINKKTCDLPGSWIDDA